MGVSRPSSPPPGAQIWPFQEVVYYNVPLDEKFLCKNALQVKFTLSLFDPGRISLRPYKKISLRNAKNEVVRTSISIPPTLKVLEYLLKRLSGSKVENRFSKSSSFKSFGIKNFYWVFTGQKGIVQIWLQILEWNFPYWLKGVQMGRNVLVLIRRSSRFYLEKIETFRGSGWVNHRTS